MSVSGARQSAFRPGAIGVLAVALLLGACTQPLEEALPGLNGDEPEDTPAPQPEDTPEAEATTSIAALVEEVAPSIVAVEGAVIEADAPLGESAGSGVIWSADGVIVTNNHVIVEADELEVVLADGSRLEAEVIAADPATDLAIISVDADGLPAATFAEELPQIGATAIALGNPLGFQNTATAGIISGLDRTLPAPPNGQPLVGMIQTDAAISSGNSGGALIDSNGVVVGINTAVLDVGGDSPVVTQGLGFAIPATTVRSVVGQLLETGEVSHPFLGIEGITLTGPLADRFGIERDRGVLVGAVQPDSPADDVDLEQGDVIIEVEGEPVEAIGDLLAALRAFDPGDTVTLTIVRDEQELQVDATLTESPN